MQQTLYCRKSDAWKIFEYQWPQSKGGEYHVLQEQISEYLGVLSFKRKYPGTENILFRTYCSEFLGPGQSCQLGMSLPSPCEYCLSRERIQVYTLARHWKYPLWDTLPRVFGTGLSVGNEFTLPFPTDSLADQPSPVSLKMITLTFDWLPSRCG